MLDLIIQMKIWQNTLEINFSIFVLGQEEMS